jgi:hypothetical protein
VVLDDLWTLVFLPIGLMFFSKRKTKIRLVGRFMSRVHMCVEGCVAPSVRWLWASEDVADIGARGACRKMRLPEW